MKYYSYIILSVALVSQQAFSQDDKNVILEDKILTLEKKISIAKSENALWRDTEKQLSSAKELIISGESQQASEVLSRIDFELDRSLAQSREQSDISQLVPHYLKH